ncbi:hypothetical protein GOV04_00895 [Candidatus Woesearchaeota archaeon]|nr:hypothetical protein [Candidatus Woesearchaeota archaeon]
MKKVILIALLTIFLAVSAFGAKEIGFEITPVDFNVEQSPVDNVISPGEQAAFNVKISNNLNSRDTYTIVPPRDLGWSVLTNPLTYYTTGVPVSAGSSAQLKLMIKSSEAITLGTYSIRIDFRSSTTEQILSRIFEITVIPKKAENVTVFLDVPQIVDPRIPLTINVNLQNNKVERIENVTVKIKSSYFEAEKRITLTPLGKQSLTFEQELASTTPPGKDSLLLAVAKGSKIITFEKKNYEIGQFSTFLKTDELIDKFLKPTTIINLENDGNIEKTENLVIPLGFFKDLITNVDYKSEVIRISGVRNKVMQLTLAPGEQITITITTNYRLPIYILLIIILTVTGYYMFRSPIIVTKKAQFVDVDTGGFHEAKILLNLKNRTPKELDNVVVIEQLPRVVDVVQEYVEGTLRPSRVGKKANKTFIEWKIPKVEAHEERLIIYRIKSKLDIVGSLDIEPTRMTFFFDNSKSSTSSNKLSIKTPELPEIEPSEKIT